MMCGWSQSGVFGLDVKDLLFVPDIVVETDLRLEELRARDLFFEPRDFVVREVFERKIELDRSFGEDFSALETTEGGLSDQ